ncbi:hypothetical protein KKA15_04025 [Patescibacteria group bacterium]|nr:hypothetical protein [Patescibacteria group bacterium]
MAKEKIIIETTGNGNTDMKKLMEKIIIRLGRDDGKTTVVISREMEPSGASVGQSETIRI